MTINQYFSFEEIYVIILREREKGCNRRYRVRAQTLSANNSLNIQSVPYTKFSYGFRFGSIDRNAIEYIGLG